MSSQKNKSKLMSTINKVLSAFLIVVLVSLGISFYLDNKDKKKSQNSTEIRHRDSLVKELEVKPDSNQQTIHSDNLAKTDKKHNKIYRYFYFTFTVISLILGSLITLILTRRAIIKQIGEEEYNKYEDNGLFDFVSIVGFIVQRKNKYKESTYKLNAKILTLESSIENQKKNIKSLETKVEVENKKEVKKTRPNNTEKTSNPPNLIEYYSIPDSQGRFKKENTLSEFSAHNTFYKIVYFDKNATLGDLSYICGEHDRRAINNYESYLRPVCEIQNLENRADTKSIKMIKSGKVKRENDCWVIDNDNRIIISFE